MQYIQIGKIICKLVIYDTSVYEKFKSSRILFLSKTDCVILVYDITNRESFENIYRVWIEEVKNYCRKDVVMVLVGNKCEQEDKRVVSYKEGKELADELGIKFYEATYKTGKNINNIFFYPAYEIFKKVNNM